MRRAPAKWDDHQMFARLLLVFAFVAGACGSIGDTEVAGETALAELAAAESTTTTMPTTQAPTTQLETTPTERRRTTSTAELTTSTFETRAITNTDFLPFATVGDVVLHLPSARIELIGFHESSHDGSQQMTTDLALLDRGPQWMTMETRERGTGDRTAADIAADPNGEIRSPVTGTVLRAGGYILYCEHQDDFIVIEPDARPGWEVKVFHISGVQVFSGARVEAGVTVIAPGPTRLPFESQIDELAAAPAWPHVHIEVVDPSIPDRPSGGGC